MFYSDLSESARALMEVAVLQATVFAGDDLVVSSELMETGWVVEQLTRRSADSAALVLEHRCSQRAVPRVQRIRRAERRKQGSRSRHLGARRLD